MATAVAAFISTVVVQATGSIVLASAAYWTAAVATTVALNAGISALTQASAQGKLGGQNSGGGQVQLTLDLNAGVPVAFGRTATAGNLVYRESFNSTKNEHLALITVLSAGGPIEAIEQFYVNDVPINFNTNANYPDATTGYSGKMWQWRRLGDTPETSVYAVGTSWAQPLPGITSAHKFSGLATTLTDLYFDAKNNVYSTGVPRMYYVLKGVKLYDPRKDSTYAGGVGTHRLNDPTTWTWSENPYLAALAWLTGRFANGRKVWGCGMPSAAIDWASFVDGANVADANGWKVGGVITTADDKWQVLTSLLQAGGGVPISRGAQIAALVNTPKVSAWSITAADLAGPIAMEQSTTPRRDRKNSVVPRYRSEAHRWTYVAATATTSSTYLTEDGSDLRTLSIDYPLVQNATQASQLAAYELTNSREGLKFTLVCKPRLLNLRTGDVCTVTLAELGLTAQKCLVTARTFDPQSCLVHLALRTETDAKHSYALSLTGSGPPSPALGLNDPNIIAAPGGTAYAASGVSFTASGTSIPAILITGTCDNELAGEVLIQYRVTGATSWTAWPPTAATTGRIEITGVTPGTQYDVQVAYRSVRGIISAYTSLGSVTVGSLLVPSASSVNSSVVWLFQRAASTPALPSATITYTFATGVATGLTNGWTTTIPTGTNPLYVTTAVAAAAGASDTIGPGEWASAVVLAQSGTAGATGPAGPNPITVGLTREAVTLFAYANGGVVSFTGADGYLTVYSGASDVTTGAALSVSASGCTGTINTSAGYPVAGQPMGYYQVTAMSGDTASLTLTAVYGGQTYVRTFSLAKARAGYEIVSSLPASSLFQGRMVFLTTDSKLYRYDGGAWTKAADGADITPGTVTTNAIAAGAITAAKLATTQLITVSAQIGDAVITNAKIGDLQVDTIKIANNAAVAPAIVTASSAIAGQGFQVWINVLEQSFTLTRAAMVFSTAYFKQSYGASGQAFGAFIQVTSISTLQQWTLFTTGGTAYSDTVALGGAQALPAGLYVVRLFWYNGNANINDRTMYTQVIY